MLMCWQVCLYFMNLVLEDYENYNFWHTPDMMERRNMYPHRFPPIREAHPNPLSSLLFLNSTAAVFCECCRWTCIPNRDAGMTASLATACCMYALLACSHGMRAMPVFHLTLDLCWHSLRCLGQGMSGRSTDQALLSLCRVSMAGHLCVCALRCAGGSGLVGALHRQRHDPGHAVEQLGAHLELYVSPRHTENHLVCCYIPLTPHQR